MVEEEQSKAPEGPVFTVHNIFVKDISYEAPQVPEIFREPWKPKLDFDLQMSSRALLEEDVYEAILHITVSIKLGETEETEKTAFLAEVQQGGVFTVKGFEKERLDYVLATTCPGILFPYAREVISSVVTKGSFPQLLLPPINFESMYQRRLAKQAQEVKTTPALKEVKMKK